MTTIGTFTKRETGFQGSITTLALKAKLTISPVEKTSDQAPDYRVYAGSVAIGAAWAMTSKAGKVYFSVKLDDPSFASPIQCRLVESDKEYSLVWNR